MESNDKYDNVFNGNNINDMILNENNENFDENQNLNNFNNNNVDENDNNNDDSIENNRNNDNFNENVILNITQSDQIQIKNFELYKKVSQSMINLINTYKIYQ